MVNFEKPEQKLILSVALVIILYLINKYSKNNKINIFLKKTYIKLIIGLIIIAFIFYNSNVKYISVVYGLLIIIALLTSNNEGFMNLFNKKEDTMMYNDFNTAYDNNIYVPTYEDMINNNEMNGENYDIVESKPMSLINKTLTFFNAQNEVIEKDNIFDNRDLCEECELKKEDINNEEHQVLNRALDIDTPNPNSVFGKPHFVNKIEPL